MKSKKINYIPLVIFSVAAISVFMCALLYSAVLVQGYLVEMYYTGIYDYCVHVTIMDASTGKALDRDAPYCASIVDDLKKQGFYNRFH